MEKLKSGLDPRLTYHGLHHTIEIVNEAMRIALAEKISNKEDLQLLRIAALFHDTGFLFIYKDHENRGCEMAREYLPAYGITEAQLETICGMIMATKIPQSPKNYLEEIICDADLDYLGRDDFYPIGRTLYREWQNYQLVKDEKDWNRKQVKFLEMHHYFTKSNIALRGEKKARHLTEIKKIVESYND